MYEVLLHLAIYLAAAVIAVPISQRLGVGSVLGYLAAGLAIGPAMHLVGSEAEAVQEYAEYGIVLMLFLINLEGATRSSTAMSTPATRRNSPSSSPTAVYSRAPTPRLTSYCSHSTTGRDRRCLPRGRIRALSERDEEVTQAWIGLSEPAWPAPCPPPDSAVIGFSQDKSTDIRQPLSDLQIAC